MTTISAGSHEFFQLIGVIYGSAFTKFRDVPTAGAKGVGLSSINTRCSASALLWRRCEAVRKQALYWRVFGSWTFCDATVSLSLASLRKRVRELATRLRRRAKTIVAGDPTRAFPLRPPLTFPKGYDEASLFAFLSTVRVADAPEADMQNYCRSDFRRFVYTWALGQTNSGRALELGANPYFTTMLLRDFSALELTLANFFADGLAPRGAQDVFYRDRQSSALTSITLAFDHFNIENDSFPYADDSFEVVFFCEILEHLLMDPLHVLGEIRRILVPGGVLILTTPNVSRLENVTRMIAGANIYDPYSGFGPYGRHNREYNKHELHHLLTYAGFAPEVMFSADVHENHAYTYASAAKADELVRFRSGDLGQYLFVRARTTAAAHTRKPDFLYRSYPPDQLERWP